MQDITSSLPTRPKSLLDQRLARLSGSGESHGAVTAPRGAHCKTYVTYEKIELYIDSVREQILSHSFDAIACVLRGGMFPAMCVAYATGLPIHFIRYDRATQTPSWVAPPPPGKLLICEDYAGNGYTLEHVIEFVTATHPAFEILTAVKDNKSRRNPRWAMDFGDQTTVLPWERDNHAQATRAAASNTPVDRAVADHTLRLTGYDLDGVFCDDLPQEHYEQDLHGCLQQRDKLAPAPTAPRLVSDNTLVITGRPLEDATRTKTWMQRHFPGVTGIQIVHRDPEVFAATDLGAAQHKAHAALQFGCTDFVESCPHQALLIAQAIPWLRVQWWNSGNPVHVTARSGEVSQGLIQPHARIT
jgi:hypoxanthine phosphoribosyltransferase